MPRHLARAVEALSRLPAAPAEGPLVEWLWCAPGFAVAGVEIPAPTRARVRALWSERPDLRDPLWHVMLGYPCDEFERTVAREVALGRGHANLLRWLRERPGLAHAWRDALRARALHGETVWQRVDAGLAWARYLGGGDDAYAALARALIREDIRQSRREHPSDFHRHDLEDHGTVTPEEAARISEFLVRFNAEPLGVICQGMWWCSPPPDAWQASRRAPRVLLDLAEASARYAQGAWSPEDEALYAAALRALPGGAGADLAADSDVARRIVALAAAPP